MGKSLGFKFAGRGPGIQKRGQLAKKYLQKNTVKSGKMSELDFDVEQVEKVPAHLSNTGLNGLRAAEASGAKKSGVKEPAATKGKAAPSAPKPLVLNSSGPSAPVNNAVRIGIAYVAARVGNFEEHYQAKAESAAKTNEKKKKKCAPC
mmetsp:Transcript_37770/g.58949  ORF Transcript_37770/g.58949 Transcript_37770/m.58949 type:complete len:148 (+) Transcript_37770:139-582(+)